MTSRVSTPPEGFGFIKRLSLPKYYSPLILLYKRPVIITHGISYARQPLMYLPIALLAIGDGAETPAEFIGTQFTAGPR